MSSVKRDASLDKLTRLQHPYGFGKRFDGALLNTVSVPQCAIDLGNVFDEVVHEIKTGRCMHPTGLFIETLVNEKLPPGHGAVSVQTLLADHMNFAPKIKRGMWVDQKKRVARRRLFWGNSNPVGTPRFCNWRYIKINACSDLRR